MRTRFIMIFIAMALAFVSVKADRLPPGHAEASMAFEAIEPAESSIPRWAGTTAVILVGLYFLLALASAPTLHGGGGLPEDIFLKIRFVPGTGGSKAGTAYLRSLSQHHATMISRSPLVKGEMLVIEVPGKEKGAVETFHARVAACRSPRDDASTYVVRLNLGHDRADEAAVRSELDYLRRSPAALRV